MTMVIHPPQLNQWSAPRSPSHKLISDQLVDHYIQRHSGQYLSIVAWTVSVLRRPFESHLRATPRRTVFRPSYI